MVKPHIKKLFGRWWCFRSPLEARYYIEGNKEVKAWSGLTPSTAFRSWRNFNQMKP